MFAKPKILATAALAAVVLAPISHTVAQIPAPRPTSTETVIAELPQLLDQTATDAEHLAETAIVKDGKQAAANLDLLKGKLQLIRSRLAPVTAAAIDIQVERADAALKSADFTMAALAGAETYRALQEAIDATARPVPLEVALLDYAGFKIEALSRATTVDWAQINAAGTEAQDFWRRHEPRVTSKSLKSTIATIFDGLATGIEHREHRQVTFAARILLDAVDLLEVPFKAADATR